MKDKIVFITGGTSGYGKAMAKLFTDEGAKVIIAARKLNDLAQTAAEIGCDAMRMDVTDFGAWKDARDSIMEKHGRIDVLINDAAVALPSRMSSIRPRLKSIEPSS